MLIAVTRRTMQLDNKWLLNGAPVIAVVHRRRVVRCAGASRILTNLGLICRILLKMRPLLNVSFGRRRWREWTLNPLPPNVTLKLDLNIFLARHSFRRRAVSQRGVH